jgi:hypothetical protein
MFPRYRPRRVELPATFWRENFSIDDFDIQPAHAVGPATSTPFRVFPEFAFAQEREKLRTLATAASEKNIALLDSDYKNLLVEDGVLSADSRTIAWPEIVRRFEEATELTTFELVKRTVFTVYVGHDEWTDFRSRSIGTDGTAPRKSGAPARPHWEEIFREALTRQIVSGRETYGGEKNLTQFAKSLHEWALLQHPGHGNSVPKAPTIAGRLKKIWDAAHSVPAIVRISIVLMLCASR